ncbi:MAG: hypothetical protein R3F14_03430 [Polyangiaceae bacterium]
MKNVGRMGWAAALAVGLMLAADAHAEPTAEDKAAAESLFQEALKLIEKNKYSDACPKLEASNKLDPAVGTLFNLGDCFEHTGRTASAWSSFGEARRLAERLKDRRAADAAEREKALEPRLAKLVVKAAERPEGLVIQRDNRPLDAALLESAVPVDPGKHTIEASAPGREAWSTTVDVPDAPGAVTVTVPPLAAARSAGPSPSGSGSAGPETPPGSGMSGQKIAGLAVAGVGVAGLVVGGVFGGLTLAKVSESNEGGHCVDGSPVRCDATGLAIRSEADTFANISNISLAVGGAAVIGGVVLFLVAPSGPAKTGKAGTGHEGAKRLAVSPVLGSVNGLTLSGSF